MHTRMECSNGKRSNHKAQVGKWSYLLVYCGLEGFLLESLELSHLQHMPQRFTTIVIPQGLSPQHISQGLTPEYGTESAAMWASSNHSMQPTCNHSMQPICRQGSCRLEASVWVSVSSASICAFSRAAWDRSCFNESRSTCVLLSCSIWSESLLCSASISFVCCWISAL